ncbi:MAG: type II toxin-antitoxin system HicA family toxin [Dehalococcoidia bacterium]
MPKLPQVSGSDVLGLLQSLGYEVVRQRGSHIRLRKDTPLGEHTITIPAHRVLAKGTLNDTLNRISLWNNISKEDLIRKPS